MKLNSLNNRKVEIRIHKMGSTILENQLPLDEDTSANKLTSKITTLSQLRLRFANKVIVGGDLQLLSQKDYAKSLGTHALLEAIHLSYIHHLPLTLTPNMVWQCILQGLGIHIQVSQKEYVNSVYTPRRDLSKQVIVETNLADEDEIPWEYIAYEAGYCVSERIKIEFRDHLMPQLSSTPHTDLLSMQTGLGKEVPVKAKFILTTGSEASYNKGISSLALGGNVGDWIILKDHLNAILRDVNYDIDWWVESLLSVLDQFIAAAEGRIDQSFWSRMYKAVPNKEGFDPFVHGWINTLFPYLVTPGGHYVQNMWPYKISSGKLHKAPTTASFPSGLTEVPVTLVKDKGKEEHFKLVTGFTSEKLYSFR